MEGAAQLRIGELARRTGVATELLRAWERRYGLLAPERTDGGYRLYSDDDVRRVRRMRELLATGLSAAEAARQASAEPRSPDAERREDSAPASASAELRGALEQLDDAAAHAAFDRLLADYSTRAVLADVVLPLLHELGAGLGAGRDLGGAGALRFEPAPRPPARAGARLGPRRGPLAPCSPARRASGTTSASSSSASTLRELGWRITFLGADTPPETVVETVRRLEPEALVLAVTDAARLDGVAETAARLADTQTAVWIGGAGAAEVDGASAPSSGRRSTPRSRSRV